MQGPTTSEERALIVLAVLLSVTLGACSFAYDSTEEGTSCTISFNPTKEQFEAVGEMCSVVFDSYVARPGIINLGTVNYGSEYDDQYGDQTVPPYAPTDPTEADQSESGGEWYGTSGAGYTSAP